MRARGGGLLLACAAIALLATPGVASARGQGVVLSSFELQGSNGYKLEVSSGQGGDFRPTIAIVASRPGLRASYEVPNQLGPGMNAAFGSVGRVALDFERQKRRVSRLEKGCTLIGETGVFRGEFTFAGEGGYTSAKTTSVPGKVSRMPNGFCGFGVDRVSLGVPDFLRASHLVARSQRQNGTIAFGASSARFDRGLGFRAELDERLGAMKVTRSASVGTRDGAELLDPGKRSHSLLIAPPPPFEDSARFRDPANGPPTWTGSLSVALPGTPTIPLAGPSFKARLCPNLFLLRKCRVPLP